MGHKDITKVPQRSILWSAGSGYVTLKTRGHVQSPRALLASFSPLLSPRDNKSHPMHVGGFLFPKAMSKWLFTLTLGCQVQARKYFLVFPCLVSTGHPYSVPVTELQWWSGGVTLPPELAPTLTPLI